MSTWTDLLIAPGTPIREVIRVLDESAQQIVLVVTPERRLEGTITDGDIRRGLLRGVGLDDPASAIMNPEPTVSHIGESRETMLASMRRKRLHRIPVVDDARVVRGLGSTDDTPASPEKPNWVVLMAGGLGTRLYPLTAETPKPMLRVGDKPLLELIIENFVEHGFRKFYVSVNFKADVVMSYFGDGSRWGVEIRYLRENERLGTAGALSLLPERPTDPLFVMNGDILTKVNLSQLLDFHTSHASAATMAVREYDIQVPYGVVRMDQHRIVALEEKPVHRCFVNAGIYVIEPEALAHVAPSTYFDMPSLFERLASQGRETSAFPIREYWLDIGRISDYEQANNDFSNHFG